MARPVMTDGHKTLLAFAGIAATNFEWREIMPPGISNGGGKKTTTHANTAWHTKAPNVLKELMDGGGTMVYHPTALTLLLAQVGVNQLITLTFPTADTLVFWGWLDEFVPDKLVAGEQPTASAKIIVSNSDADGDETPPIYTDVA